MSDETKYGAEGWKVAHDLATELDRLRAINVEMKKLITDLLTDDFEYNWPDKARAVLAKWEI